jgi:hypothetical protein
MSRPTSRAARARWEVVFTVLAERYTRTRSISKTPMGGVATADREVDRAVCIELELTRKNSRRKEEV